MSRFDRIKCSFGFHSTRIEERVFTLTFGGKVKEYNIGKVEYCTKCGKTTHIYKYSLKRISKEKADEISLKRRRKEKLHKLKIKEIESSDCSQEYKDLFKKFEEITSRIRH